jgi:hypothetical protein
MAKLIAGLKSVAHADTKAANKAGVSGTTNYTLLTGKISPESAINPANTTSDTTDGRISAGSSATPSILMMDNANYAALLALANADTEKYWYLEYFDGRVYVSAIPTNIQVLDQMTANMRDGVSAYEISFEKYHITAPFFQALS